MKRFICCRSNLFCHKLTIYLCRMNRQQRIKCETVVRHCFLYPSHLTPGHVVVAEECIKVIDTLTFSRFHIRLITPVTWVRQCSKVFKSDGMRWNPSLVGLPTASRVSQEECHLLRCPLTAAMGLLKQNRLWSPRPH